MAQENSNINWEDIDFEMADSPQVPPQVSQQVLQQASQQVSPQAPPYERFDDLQPEEELPAHTPILQLSPAKRISQAQWSLVEPFSYAELETSTELRWEWLEMVDAALYPIPHNACLSDLKQVLRIDDRNIVGEGSYGRVYEVTLKNGPEFPLALKSVLLNPGGRYEEKAVEEELVNNTYKEVVAMTYVNALVKLEVGPHYPLLYQPFLCHRGRQLRELNIVEEFSSGTVAKWLLKQRTDQELFGLIFQCFIAVATVQTCLSMVNNDLKDSNILYNETDVKTTFIYDFFGQRYFLPTQGYLFKLADWGLSSASYLGRSHGFAPSLKDHEPTPLPSFADPQAYGPLYDRHPLGYRVNGEPIPPYKRDYMMIIYMLLHESVTQVQPKMPVDFLLNVLRALNELPIETLKQRIDIFNVIFSQGFLASQGGLVLATLLQPPANPERQRFQQFQVDHEKIVPQAVPLHALIKQSVEERLPMLTAI